MRVKLSDHRDNTRRGVCSTNEGILSRNCLKLLHDFIGFQALFSMIFRVSQRIINAKYFPDAMLFLQVFIRISLQFGGFSEQHQLNSREIPREIFHICITGMFFE